jgi:hypothetical protein
MNISPSVAVTVSPAVAAAEVLAADPLGAGAVADDEAGAPDSSAEQAVRAASATARTASPRARREGRERDTRPPPGPLPQGAAAVVQILQG